jgi:hypothetical protein
MPIEKRQNFSPKKDYVPSGAFTDETTYRREHDQKQMPQQEQPKQREQYSPSGKFRDETTHNHFYTPKTIESPTRTIRAVQQRPETPPKPKIEEYTVYNTDYIPHEIIPQQQEPKI